MPALGPWLALFAVPLIAAIILTCLTLRVILRRDQRQPIARDVRIFALERSGRIVLAGIAITASGPMGLFAGLTPGGVPQR